MELNIVPAVISPTIMTAVRTITIHVRISADDVSDGTASRKGQWDDLVFISRGTYGEILIAGETFCGPFANGRRARTGLADQGALCHSSALHGNPPA